MAPGDRMHFVASELAGAWLAVPKPVRDTRGFFARTFCQREFAERGMTASFVQHSTSFNIRKGTLRGLHFQRAPHAEVKVVTCTRGSIRDVIVDLRPDSSTYGRWQAFSLTEKNRARLYVPKGFAHGYQTLADDTEVGYLISEFHEPMAAAGIRYDDPTLDIRWPLVPAALSERDLAWPRFAELGP